VSREEGMAKCITRLPNYPSDSGMTTETKIASKHAPGN
jgi:hypothetical protein